MRLAQYLPPPPPCMIVNGGQLRTAQPGSSHVGYGGGKISRFSQTFIGCLPFCNRAGRIYVRRRGKQWSIRCLSAEACCSYMGMGALVLQ